MIDLTPTAAPPTPFDEMWKEWQNTAREWQTQNLENWGSMTRNVVAADSFFSVMSASMDCYLAGLKKMREAWQLTMQIVDVPRMQDLARISNQVLTSETRVVDCEERVDHVVDDLGRLQRRVVEAEEQARAARQQAEKLERRLAELEERLGAMSSPSPEKAGDDVKARNSENPKRRK